MGPPAAPQRLRQDPGHAGRPAGHRGRRSPRASTSTSRSCSASTSTGTWRGPTSPACATGWSAARTSGAWHRSPASSSAGSTRRSDKALDAIGTDDARALRGQAAIANAKLAYDAYQEIFEGDEFADLRGCRRPRAALPVGEHLDQEPGLPRRALRGGADRPPDGRHHAAGDDRGIPRPRPAGAHPRPGRIEAPARRCAQVEAQGISMRHVTDELIGEGVASFAQVLRRADRCASTASARHSPRHERRPARRGDRGAARRAGRRSGSPSGCGRRTAACGPPPARHPTKSQPGWAGWTCPMRCAPVCRSSSTWRATSAATATPAPPCSAWEAPAWPRSSSLARSARERWARPMASSCASSTRPTPTLCAPSANGDSRLAPSSA